MSALPTCQGHHYDGDVSQQPGCDTLAHDVISNLEVTVCPCPIAKVNRDPVMSSGNLDVTSHPSKFTLPHGAVSEDHHNCTTPWAC